MAFRITEKGLSFETAIDPQLNVTVMGDPTFLNQILLNLLGNAAKFTEKGSIFLTAQCTEKTKKSIKAKISVS